MKLRRGFLKILSRFLKDRTGSVMVYSAVIAPVLLGAAALSVDVAAWHMYKKAAQSAADSAAMGAALELMRTGAGNVTAAARSDAASNGFRHGADGTTVEVFSPPTSGIRAGDPAAVEVVVTRPAPSFLSGFVSSQPVSVKTRSVAVGALDDTCIWVLDPDAAAAMKIAGGATVGLDCGAFVNSNDSDALDMDGAGACLTATRIRVVGGIDDNGCITSGSTKTGVTGGNDPLSWVDAPAYGGCDVTSTTNVSNGETVTMTPDASGVMVICEEVKVLQGGTLHFDPGLYVFNGGGLTVNGNATVTGADVHFYWTEFNTGSDNISVSNGANVTLSAGATGDLAGILFYHDRNSPDGISHNITGGNPLQLDGILYFPNQHLKFAGGSSLDATESMIVANTISFSGNTDIGDFSGTTVATNPLLVQAALVE